VKKLQKQMGRIFANIRVGRRDCWTLFDSGAERTYVVKDVARELSRGRLKKTWSTRLGGSVHRIRQDCTLRATVEGKQLDTRAYVIDEIGHDPKGQPIDILFGALSMQEYQIVLDMKNEALDLSHFPKEFVEF